MKYSSYLFKADQHPELCMEYCQKHAAVLTDYGCTNVTSHKERWMTNPNVYVIAIYDELGEMVSGIRIHFYHEAFPLSIETAIAHYDDKISLVIKQYAEHKTGEMCGLWTARSLRSKGFGAIMTGVGIAAAGLLGAKSLFGLAAPHTYDMFSTFGYTRMPEVGRNGDFLYPTADYISTVMVIPDLVNLEHASPIHTSKIASLRENPVQFISEGADNSVFIAHHLDPMADNISLQMKGSAVAA